MDTEMTTEEIKAHLTDPDANVAAAAALYCEGEREELLDEIDALREEIAKGNKAAEDAFIEDLKASRKLAPKDEAMETALRNTYRNDPEAARVLAKNLHSEKDGETADVAGGKVPPQEDNRSLAELMESEQ